jgi:hypothetical protein
LGTIWKKELKKFPSAQKMWGFWKDTSSDKVASLEADLKPNEISLLQVTDVSTEIVNII